MYFFLLLNISCEKDETCHCNTEETCKTPTENDDIAIYEAGTQEFGWATASKNGYCWEASSSGIYAWSDSTSIAIYMFTYTTYQELREYFIIGNLKVDSIGRYEIKQDTQLGAASASLTLFGLDGDVLIAGWKLLENECNYINITEIDTIANTIKGEFDVHLTKDWGDEDEDIIQDIHFTNGKFETSILE